MTLQNVSELWLALMSVLNPGYVFSWNEDDEEEASEDWGDDSWGSDDSDDEEEE